MPYYLTTSQHKLFYRRYGYTGPIIVLIHGLASSSRIWLKQIRVLKEHFQVYALDLPGHGKSDWLEQYSFKVFANLLKEWMDYCHINKADIMALSLGCPIALVFALNHPEQVNTIILEGAIAGYRAWYNPLGWFDWLVFQYLPIGLRLSILFFGRKSTAHWINEVGVKNRRGLKKLESLQALVDLKAVRQLLWESTFPPYIGKLSQIKNTTLLIRGQQDPFPLRFSRYLQMHIPNALLIEVPGTRHIIGMESPTKFNKIVLDFLKVNAQNSL